MKSRMGLAVLWSVFGYYIYFSLTSAFNFAFSGLGIKFIDIGRYWIISSGLVYIGLFANLRRRREKVSSRQIVIFLAVVTILIILYATNTMYENPNRMMENALRYFFLFSMPAAFCGLYAYKNITVTEIEKWVDPLVVIFFFGLTAGYINWITKGGSIKLGGDTYQSFSYAAAFGLAMDVYMVLYSNKKMLMKMFSTKFFSVARLVLLPAFAFFTIAGGGRGAFVLVVFVGLFVLVDKFALSKRWKEFVGIMILSALAIGVLAVAIQNNPQMQKKYERATAFISEDYQIDLENGSSGRDKIYSRSEDAIKESPVVGYGPMGGLKKFRLYSHNVYYDLMLEGGAVYLTVWICVFIAMFRRLYWFFKKGKEYYIYAFLFMCPFTILQFSAYYIMQGGLWFFVAFLLSFKADELRTRRKRLVVRW